MVYLTVEIVEASQEQVVITDKGLKASAIQGNTGENYAVNLEFYADIDVSECKQQKTDRYLFFTLKKLEKDQPYWPRLLKAGKPHYVHTDFSRWKDEDEEDEEAAPFPGFGGGFPGMGGAGDMDFSKFDMGDDDGEGESHSDEGENASESSGEDDPYQKTSQSALVEDQ